MNEGEDASRSHAMACCNVWVSYDLCTENKLDSGRTKDVILLRSK